jgi:hypothetical protein
VNDFERDLAPEPGIASPPHLTHAARADRSEDLVRAESGARADFHETSDGFHPRAMREMRSAAQRNDEPMTPVEFKSLKTWLRT